MQTYRVHFPLYMLTISELINSKLSKLPYSNVWIRLPLRINNHSSWSLWNVQNTLSKNNPKLNVALQLTDETIFTDEEINQWTSERVKAILIPSEMFVMNKKGYPVLIKPIQSFLLHFITVIYAIK